MGLRVVSRIPEFLSVTAWYPSIRTSGFWGVTGNLSNNPNEQVEGKGAGNVDAPILFSNNSNEFQAFMQELKS